jgi:hypothetical protein
MTRPVTETARSLSDEVTVQGYSLSGVLRLEPTTGHHRAPDDRVPLNRHELPPLPPSSRFLPEAVDVDGERPALPADAQGGELLVTRSPSPDGGYVCTLWFCVRGAGNGYSPDDPAYWAEVLLGPRFPGGG